MEKISSLSGAVTVISDSLKGQADRVEGEKLRAIGQRNQAAAAAELRRRLYAEAQQALAERQVELERLKTEHDALKRVKQEQEALIAKLSDTT